MIKCPNNNCGAENEDGAKFCEMCCTPLPQDKECPSCHNRVKLTAKFCAECGFNFNKQQVADKSGSMLSMGDKNVIAGDVVGHQENVKVAGIERLDSGLVRINGGEENGGFDLISNDSTVYYEIGMSDIKSYYELGKVTLPVSDEFEYIDESNLDAEAKIYYPGDFLSDDADMEYNFSPNNTSVVIENGEIIKMNKVYMP